MEKSKIVPSLKSVYIDTNIFLNAVLYDHDIIPEAKLAHSFLEKIIENQVIAYTSVLTWDEYVYIIQKNLGLKIAIQKGDEFLIFPHLHFQPVTFDILQHAQSLRKKYSIKPRDSIHLATATAFNIHEFITLDQDFAQVSEIISKSP